MRTAVIPSFMLVLLLAGAAIGRALDVPSVALAKEDSSSVGLAKEDEAVINVEVNAADHELQEGYFALGEQGTVMAKPGSELFSFLSRQRGQKVKIVLSRAEKRELSRLQR